MNQITMFAFFKDHILQQFCIAELSFIIYVGSLPDTWYVVQDKMFFILKWQSDE